MISQNNIDDNDLIDDVKHQQLLAQQIEQDKSHLVNIVVMDGDIIMKNMENKAKLVEIERRKLIKEILKLGKKIHTKEELQSYSITDLRDIQSKLFEKRKSFVESIISFFI